MDTRILNVTEQCISVSNESLSEIKKKKTRNKL